MAAKDYNFKAKDGVVYLSKKLADSTKLSKDNRVVTDKEIIGLFGFYFSQYCVAHNTNIADISVGDFKFKVEVNSSNEGTDEQPSEA